VDALPKVNVGLDPLHVAIDTLPKISVGLDPLHIEVDRLPKVQIGLDAIDFRLTEFPSLRVHLPADFHVGISVLGHQFLGVRLCGEAQVITEPYVANPCERFDMRELEPVADLQPVGKA
jgi:hypothetical protein